MEEIVLLRALPPAEARGRLIALARAQGPAALATLRSALADPALAAAALEALAEVPAQEAWDLLAQTAQSGAAGLRKAARRGQHRLRSRGFQPAPLTPHPTAAPAVEQARATPFDVTGSQFLHLVRPAPLGMAHYADFIVGPEGLNECGHLLLNRPDLDEILDEQGAKFGPDLAEVGLPYVARRARTGAAQSRAAGKPLPRDWPAAARLLEDAPQDALPDELASVPSQEPVTLREALRLLRHRSMVRWLLDPERLAPHAEDWLRLLKHQPLHTEEGLPNLGAVQAQGQFVARILADLGDAATLQRLVGQLAEQSRLFYTLGERELAGLALRCSVGLEQTPGPGNTFLRALVEVSMEQAVRFLQEEAAAEAQGPWVQVGGAAGPLWVPRPAAPPEAEEENPTPRLWLPGQR